MYNIRNTDTIRVHNMYGVRDGFRQFLLFSSTGPASYSCVYVSDAIHELGKPLLPKGRAMSINIQNNCENNAINRSRLIPSYLANSAVCQIMAEMLKRNGFSVNYYAQWTDIANNIMTRQKQVGIRIICSIQYVLIVVHLKLATLFMGNQIYIVFFKLQLLVCTV